MKKRHVHLTESDRLYLEELLSKGTISVRKQKRAQGLLELDKSKTFLEVADIVGRRYQTLITWSKNYKSEGLSLLEDKPRSGRPIRIAGEERAKVTALACSDPPEGYAVWSLRLLADRAVELGLCAHLSHTEAGKILKKTNCSPTGSVSGASDA